MLLGLSLTVRAHVAELRAVDSIAYPITPLEPGDQCPDFELAPLVNTEQERLRLSDFKGKLVILDFWATWCGSCMVAMPKLNDLQEKYKDRVQVIGVTYEDKEKITDFCRSREERLNKAFTKFPTVTDDTILGAYFPRVYIPHVVWIGTDGKVLAITDTDEVTEENVSNILDKQPVHLNAKTDRNRRDDIDIRKAFFLENMTAPLYSNEGVTEGGIRYRSVITRSADKVWGMGGSYRGTGRILSINSPLESLFGLAYGFEAFPSGEALTLSVQMNRMAWEVGPNGFYDRPEDEEEKLEFYKSSDNSYCYELVFPDYYEPEKSNKKTGVYVDTTRRELSWIASNIMKQDLAKWTGFHAAMVPRKVKALVLTLTDSTKIVSGETYEKSEYLQGVRAVFKDSHMRNFKRAIPWYALQLAPPLIDETNYYGPINMKLDCNPFSVPDLQRELAKYGLKLKEEDRVMPILVVRNDLDF